MSTPYTVTFIGWWPTVTSGEYVPEENPPTICHGWDGHPETALPRLYGFLDVVQAENLMEGKHSYGRMWEQADSVAAWYACSRFDPTRMLFDQDVSLYTDTRGDLKIRYEVLFPHPSNKFGHPTVRGWFREYQVDSDQPEASPKKAWTEFDIDTYSSPAYNLKVTS